LNLSKLTQTAKTKEFIRKVKSLVETGVIKSYAIIAESLDWNPSMLSNVINGRQNVPNDKYKLFSELYPIPGEKVKDTKEDGPSESAPGQDKAVLALVESNKDVSEGIKYISKTNYELTLLLKQSVGVVTRNQPGRGLTFAEAYHNLLVAGVQEGRWSSEDEGQDILDNVFDEISKKHS
jgi:hypothetical protein